MLAKLFSKSKPKEDPDLPIVRNCNYILASSGFSKENASSQIFSSADTRPALTTKNLRYLTRYASVLANHPGIVCDFDAFSTQLWGIVSATLSNLNFLNSIDVTGNSKEHLPQQKKNRFVMADLLIPRTHAQLHARVYASISRAVSASIIIRSFEFANVKQLEGRQAAKSRLYSTEKDIANLVHLSYSIVQLFHILASPSLVSGTLSVVDNYSSEGHHLLRLVELATASLESLLAVSVAREGIDMVGILKFFSSKEAWQVSGCGILVTEAYCQSIQQVLFTLFRRRKTVGLDKYGFEVLVTRLFMNRIVERPPFQWEVFQLLFFSNKDLGAKVKDHLLMIRGARVGLMLSFYKVQQCIETCLVLPREGSRSKHLKNIIVAIRHAVSRHLDAMVMQEAVQGSEAKQAPQSGSEANPSLLEARAKKDGEMPPSASLGYEEKPNRSKFLSFYHLLAFSAIKGMPETNLSDNAQIVERALSTNFVDPSNKQIQTELCDGEFLRLFLASAFIVPTSVSDSTTRKSNTYNKGSHARLEAASVLSLYDSYDKFIFGTALLSQNHVSFAYSISPHTKELYVNFGARLMHLLLENLLYLCSINAAWEEDNTSTSNWPTNSDHKPSTTASDGRNSAGVNAAATISKNGSNGHDVVNNSSDHSNNSSALPVLILNKIEATVNLFYALSEKAFGAEMTRENILSSAIAKLDAQSGRGSSEGTPLDVNDLEDPTLFMVQQFSMLLCNKELVVLLPMFTTLKVLAKVYALRMAYDRRYTLSKRISEQERKSARMLVLLLESMLTFLPTKMKAQTVNQVLLHLCVPKAIELFQSRAYQGSLDLSVGSAQRGGQRGSETMVKAPDVLQLSLLEAYLRSLASSTASYAITRENMLRHWVEVAMPCITQRWRERLAIAGHDFLAAPAIARVTIAPLFIPTYVSLFIPLRVQKYGEPRIALVKKFSSSVRSVCMGLEKCNATELAALTEDTSSELYRLFQPDIRVLTDSSSSDSSTSSASRGGKAIGGVPVNSSYQRALGKVTPESSVLLIVSALFDKLCLLWTSTTGSRQESQQRFVSYFSGLVYLLKCEDSYVLHRVSASIEAVMVEQLRDTKPLQKQFLKFIGDAVDGIKGTHKRAVAEWYLSLCKKIETNLKGSKL